ncbi:hypothetical protein HYZ97_03185 [Candidatus Pacearchaeota archaeon]|nr:hypothetical protein [Candidatus Pacearchaeota archaeon]
MCQLDGRNHSSDELSGNTSNSYTGSSQGSSNYHLETTPASNYQGPRTYGA